MRPRGEIRMALAEAAELLAREVGAATWRDMAQRAQVGYRAAERTVGNMARAGELQRVGRAEVPHSRKPMVLYAPVAPAGAAAAGRRTVAPGGDLATVLQAWRCR